MCTYKTTYILKHDTVLVRHIIINNTHFIVHEFLVVTRISLTKIILLVFFRHIIVVYMCFWSLPFLRFLVLHWHSVQVSRIWACIVYRRCGPYSSLVAIQDGGRRGSRRLAARTDVVDFEVVDVGRLVRRAWSVAATSPGVVDWVRRVIPGVDEVWIWNDVALEHSVCVVSLGLLSEI